VLKENKKKKKLGINNAKYKKFKYILENFRMKSERGENFEKYEEQKKYSKCMRDEGRRMKKSMTENQ
jgi:hypothetical protein